MPAVKEMPCPGCKWPTVYDPALPLNKQRCHRCAHRLAPREVESREVSFDLQVSGRSRDRGTVRLALVAGAVCLLAWAWTALRPKAALLSASPPRITEANFPTTPYADAQAMAERVLAADNVTALHSLLRPKTAGEIDLGGLKLPLGGRVISVTPEFAFNGHALHRASVVTGAGRPLRMYLEKAAGCYLADWPSLLGVSERSFPSLLAQPPTKPVLLRVLVAATNHAEPPFADVRKWFCVLLHDATQEHALYGYLDLERPALAQLTKRIPLASEQDSVLDRWENEAVALPLTVRVVAPQQPASADQVEVLEVLGSGWFIP